MATLTLTPAASAQIQTVPSGLNPGDSYRLVFVTSTTRDASSSNIADYNTFVSGRAAAVPALAALPTTWTAIAATSAVDVRANTATDPVANAGTSVPIYQLGGLRVADGYTDLWDDSIANAISITETGTSVNVKVWTGVGSTFANEYRLGTGGWNWYGKSAGTVKTPHANRVGGTGWTANLDQTGTTPLAFYAISGIITVPLLGSDLLSFIWGSHIGVIDQNAKTVSLTVPYGTDLPTINPTCTVSSGASVSPASGANAGFTESNKTVTYTVTSGTSHTDYAATVTVLPASPACDMLTFKSGNYSAAIVGTNVTLMVPSGTDVMTLAPTYTMSPNAKEDVSYPSGSTRDFTSPQAYTITAENGTATQTYRVSVLTVPVTVPRGLNPGDQYRLVFVTNGTRDALSADIADYNGFVTTAATAATAAPELGPLAATWTAIAATSAVDVRANTATDPVANAGTSVPIYNLGGLRVADGYADLWDASIANAISITETGNGRNAKVWTGVGETFQNEYRLGGTGWCYYGLSTGTVRTPYGNRVGGTGWTANLDTPGTASLSLYAISDILTVPVGGSAACNLISFNYGTAVGVITPGTPNTVLLTVPYGAPPLTSFTPAVTTSAFATFSPTGAQDFSNTQAVPVPYTVTAENGTSQQTYQVTVVKAAPSTACDMVSFTAGGVAGVITPSTPNTVVVTLPPGTDVSALTPTVVVSPLAGYAPAGEQNFTGSATTPLTYTVTAEDGTTKKDYAVTVALATRPPNDDFVNAIALPGTSGIQTGTGNVYATLETGEPGINGATHTVWFKWTAPSNGSYTISTVGSTKVGGGEWDAMLGIYTGSAVDALTLLPVADNPQDNDVPETKTVPVTAGTIYHIQAAGFENQEASNIKLTCTFVGTGTSYGTWETANGASGGASADSNNNGVPNGVEFFMGGTQASPATLPPLVGNAGTWTWTLAYDPAALATYKFQVSGNLADWADVLPGDAKITVLTGPDRLRLTLPSGMRFCRLMVATP
jgi:hypothetical protein